MRAAEGGQLNEVRSRSNLDLAPSSELRYLGRSASRQSSLPINLDYQQTATNYLLYQSRTYTEQQIFFAFHKLLKRYMKAQQLVQCMVPRALFGGVWNTSKSVYSSGSQPLRCPDPALAAPFPYRKRTPHLYEIFLLRFVIWLLRAYKYRQLRP